MLRVSAETWVAVEPQRAWDLYADVERSVDWVPFAEEIIYLRGEPGTGQEYRERTRLLGVTGEQTWRIVDWDPPRRQVQFSTDLGMDSELVIEIVPEGAGTRIRQGTRLRSRAPRPLRWFHDAIFALVSRYGLSQAVAGARERLERDTS